MTNSLNIYGLTADGSTLHSVFFTSREEARAHKRKLSGMRKHTGTTFKIWRVAVNDSNLTFVR